MTDRRLPILLSGLTGLRAATSFLTYALAAWRFGVGTEMDLFFLAIIPFLAAVNISEAAGVAGAINFYARLQHVDAAERERRVAGLFVYVGGALLLLGGIMGLGAAPLAGLLGGGFPAEHLPRVLTMLRLSAVGVCLAPFGIIAGVGLLRARGQFLTAAGLPFVPIAVVAVALLTVANTAERLLAAFVVGHGAAAAIGLLAAARAVRPSWRAPRGAAALAFLREVLPLAVAELLLQALYLRERQLAAALPPGSLSALALGQRLVAVAGAVVSAGIEHTALPTIARAQFGGAASRARHRSRDALAFAAVLALSVGLALFFRPDLWVTLAFHRGAFDELAVAMTATAAAGYVGLYVFNALGRVAIAANFARGLGWRVAGTNGVVLLTYLALSVPLARATGFAGLALAATVSFVLGTLGAVAVGLTRRDRAPRVSAGPMPRADVRSTTQR